MPRYDHYVVYVNESSTDPDEHCVFDGPVHGYARDRDVNARLWTAVRLWTQATRYTQRGSLTRVQYLQSTVTTAKGLSIVNGRFSSVSLRQAEIIYIMHL
jgi:hypothetical protein